MMKPDTLPLLGVLLSIVFWLVDSSIDVLLFKEDESILENIISPGGVELWMRCLVVCLLVIFSFYSRSMIKRQINIASELEHYKKELEDIVVARTEDLQIKNQQLENEIVVRRNIEESLEKISVTDPLTGLYNRRKFSEMLKTELECECRSEITLSLVLCDIDQFKLINDKYGHSTGDNVLIGFSRLLADSLRKTDMLARWGGEEFVFLLPDTSLEQASGIAEKLRQKIADHSYAQVGTVTASFGIACFTLGDSEESLFARADSALYEAKESGRNRVRGYDA